MQNSQATFFEQVMCSIWDGELSQFVGLEVPADVRAGESVELLRLNHRSNGAVAGDYENAIAVATGIFGAVLEQIDSEWTVAIFHDGSRCHIDITGSTVTSEV